MMKEFRFSMLGVLLASTLATVHQAPAAPARGPVISPSVKAAHRYKYNPPRNWIRHYGGDDRYKIAGGIWKVVTTPNDRYVYPAYAREMLARSPHNIIGFNTTDEAMEAGYVLHPAYNPAFNAPSTVVSSVTNTVPQSYGDRRTTTEPRVTVQRSSARRIALDDRVSSAVLPRGWSYTKSAPKPVYGSNLSADIFMSPDTKTYVVFLVGRAPELSNSILNATSKADQLRSRMGRYNSSGRINTRLSNEVKALLGSTSARLGGLPAITALSKEFPGVLPVPDARVTMAARGTKFYMAITPSSTRSSQVRSILNSFRPR